MISDQEDKSRENEYEEVRAFPTFIKNVLVIGDSITAGTFSSDYISMLQKNIGHSIRIINEGSSGDTTFSIKARLTATNWFTGSLKLLNPNEPLPDVIVLQVGTCNIISAVNENYRSIQKLPPEWKTRTDIVPFTLEGFVTSYNEILQICATRAPKAHLAVLSIPPLGEDLLSEINQVVTQYNVLLKDICNEFKECKVRYLELGETLSKMLATYYTSADRAPPKFEFGMWNVMWNTDTTTIGKYLTRKSWSQISKENGLYLYHDHIHFNEIAGGVVASLIEDFMKTLNAK